MNVKKFKKPVEEIKEEDFDTTPLMWVTIIAAGSLLAWLLTSIW